jgi:type IX secretion system PorP/SprF family membrane protein
MLYRIFYNKIKSKKEYCFILLTFFVHQFAIAQDIHFSQFYNSPLTANPANTGFMPDADYRVGLNYRKQYQSVPVPYRTSSAFGDFQVARDKFYNSWFGAGFVVLSDKAGTASLNSSKIYGSIAYHQILGESSTISLGVQGGLVSKRIDLSKLTFDNQWNGKFFDVLGPVGENFAATSTKYFDLNLGLNYAAYPSENSYFNLGVAVQHINTPRETFFSGVTAGGTQYDTKLARRYTAFFNGSFKLSDQVILNPQGYVTNMAKVTQVNLGANMHYNLSGEGGESQLIGGAYYRLNDAIVPMLGLKHKSVTATFTYDATATSKLAPFNSMRGGSEISIIHTGIFANRAPRDTKCASPSF